VEFSKRRLEGWLAAAGAAGAAGAGGAGGGAARVVRLKGVFRVGEDDWVLAQAGDQFFDLRPTSWRRDSRVELLVGGAEAFEVADWDAGWLQCQHR